MLKRSHTAQYINPAGFAPTKPPTVFAFHPAFERVFVVGDLAAWNAANPNVGALEVVRVPFLVFSSSSSCFVFLSSFHAVERRRGPAPKFALVCPTYADRSVYFTVLLPQLVVFDFFPLPDTYNILDIYNILLIYIMDNLLIVLTFAYPNVSHMSYNCII
jgi:hypothetical protein